MTVVSSDDEFMMMDQTNIWYDKMTGESNLLIVPNAEHLLLTNLPAELSASGTFFRSIASGHPVNSRPKFNYTYNETDGMITVQTNPNDKVVKVEMRHAETLSKIRRDFRWFMKTSNYTEACEWPWIKLPFGWNVMGADCL